MRVTIVYDDLLLKRDRAKAIGDMINTKKVFCFKNFWLLQKVPKRYESFWINTMLL